MNKTVDFSKPVNETIKEFPETKELLKSLGFGMIDHAAVRETVGKITSINKGARIKKIPVEIVVKAFEEQGFEVIQGESGK